MKVLLPHLIKAVKEYYNIDEEEFIKMFDDDKNMNACNEEWESRVDNDTFYKHSVNYTLGLVAFNNLSRVCRVLNYLVDAKDLKILDYGGGIGELGMTMARNNDVYYYDLDGEIQNFAKFVSEKTKRPMTFLKEDEVFNKKYDVIILMDVLEHLENPLEVFTKLANCLTYQGLIITSGYSFVIKKEFPMHLEKNRAIRPVLQSLMDEKFLIVYFHTGCDETVYGLVKKGEEEK